MISPDERAPDLTEIVILGMSLDGHPFRPSNWWERLCDMLAVTGHDGRVIYSSYLLPKVIQGYPSVVVRLALEAEEPTAYNAVRQFVLMNRLRVRPGRIHKGGHDSDPSVERRSGELSGL